MMEGKTAQKISIIGYKTEGDARNVLELKEIYQIAGKLIRFFEGRWNALREAYLTLRTVSVSA